MQNAAEFAASALRQENERHRKGHIALNLVNLDIIVVEHNRFIQDVMRGVLCSLGVKGLRFAEAAGSAFDMFRQTPPDIIFADWAPSLDGIELLREVRNNADSPDRFVPVVMVTANREHRHICTARDAGMTEYLIKPFSAKLIYARICSVVERQRMFIRNRNYFGPNRRRRRMERKGGERRTRDIAMTFTDKRRGQVPFNWPESRQDNRAHIVPDTRRRKRL